jgi:hypothetical protein
MVIVILSDRSEPGSPRTGLRPWGGVAKGVEGPAVVVSSIALQPIPAGEAEKLLNSRIIFFVD